MGKYAGIDIGGTKCAVSLAEKKTGSIKDKIRFMDDTSKQNKILY